MASSLSNLVDNIAERIHKIKCKDCDRFLEHDCVKDNLIKYKCLTRHKDYSNKIDKELKKRFNNTFKFPNNDINKFILVLRKGVYTYEYIDKWEKFNETPLSEKEEPYSNLNMEDLTDVDQKHGKRVCKDFEFKKIVNIRNIVMIFILKVEHYFWLIENFRKISLEIYQLDPANICSTNGIS